VGAGLAANGAVDLIPLGSRVEDRARLPTLEVAAGNAACSHGAGLAGKKHDGKSTIGRVRAGAICYLGQMGALFLSFTRVVSVDAECFEIDRNW
jgi:hypothetical protein